VVGNQFRSASFFFVPDTTVVDLSSQMAALIIAMLGALRANAAIGVCDRLKMVLPDVLGALTLARR
jgi:hypothetical protein